MVSNHSLSTSQSSGCGFVDVSRPSDGSLSLMSYGGFLDLHFFFF